MIILNLINNFFHLKTWLKKNKNQEYEGLIFQSEDLSYRSRLAKKTNRKEGYFVVFYEKDDFNKNKPYSIDNAPDFILIWIKDQNRIGLFKFPKNIFIEKNILSTSNQKGKMGLRVYPTWCTNLNNIAKHTQNWQIPYFKTLT